MSWKSNNKDHNNKKENSPAHGLGQTSTFSYLYHLRKPTIFGIHARPHLLLGVIGTSKLKACITQGVRGRVASCCVVLRGRCRPCVRCDAQFQSPQLPCLLLPSGSTTLLISNLHLHGRSELPASFHSSAESVSACGAVYLLYFSSCRLTINHDPDNATIA